MKTLKTLAFAAIALIGASTGANAAEAFLATDDFVGISFWLISMGMLAATAFFFMEQANVSTQWRKSVNVAGLVTGIAFIHYMYMRAVWVETGDTPTVYRYIDWLITVPLQLVEFYLILAAVRKATNWNILENINWFYRYACRWICWRSWIHQCNARFHYRNGWMDLYY